MTDSMHILEIIWSLSCVAAFVMTIPICVLAEIARSRGILPGEDAWAGVLFLSWFLGPIAVVAYLWFLTWLIVSIFQRQAND